MNSGIYKIINKIDGKYYVGSSSNLNRRWNVHKFYLNNNKHHNLYLQNSWNKYGSSNFKFLVIKKIPKKDLLIIEQKYLDRAKLKRNECYNLSFLADRVEMTDDIKSKISKTMTGRKFNEEHKRKIGDAHRGKIVSKKTKKKMKLAKLGSNHPMFGKRHSEKTKKKIGDSQRGSMGNNYGKHPSKKTLEKMRKSHMGDKNPMFGKGYLIKGKLHPLYDSKFYKFKNIMTDDIFIGTQYDFRKKYKLHQSSVSRLINGTYESSQNWKFSKYDGEGTAPTE